MLAYKTVSLEQGPIRYRELGSGEPIVFVHGYLVDGRLWDAVAERLADSGHRCLVPDWPLGAHALPMAAEADLSPPGIARLIADFIDRACDGAATVVGNDSGGAMAQVLTADHPDRVSRLVLTNCDTFESFPPSLFKLLPPIARIPGAIAVTSLPFRIGALRRAAFGPFAKRPIPADLIDAWMEPSSRDRAIRRDLAKVTAGMNKRHTLAAAERLRAFEGPALLAWAPEDRVFKIADARRLAGSMTNARLEEIADARTFVALDQPERLAELIAAFMRDEQPTPARPV